MGERFPESSLLNQKIFEAYFFDGQNLANQNLLVKLAGEAGLSTQEAREVLENHVFKEAVDVDWMRSRQIGISGLPTFVIGQYGIAGTKSYEMLERFVIKNTH